MRIVELSATTNFTFLTGASHPEEMVERAALLGLDAVAITDRNSLAGVVRAHGRLKAIATETPARRAPGVTGADVVAHARRVRGLVRVDPSSRLAEPLPEGAEAAPDAYRSIPRLVVGSRLTFVDSAVEVVALAPDRAGYAALSRLLTHGKRRAAKGTCRLSLGDLDAFGSGLVGLIALPDPLPAVVPPPDGPGLRGKAHADAARIARAFGRAALAMAPAYDGRDAERFDTRRAEAQALGLPVAATADPIMHRGSRRRLADVLTCLRERCTVDTLGRRALPNAERRLRGPEEMARLFAGHEDALAEATAIADACAFSLDDLAYRYPDEVVDGEAPQPRLERLAREGLAWRYPDGVPDHARDLVARELDLIGHLGFAPYFLTVHDIVAFARSRGILVQGRGSAANSATCYALGITEIAPERITMVFERFVSEARGEPPDIDVDFEHERREEVIQWIYARYGRERAGLCATVIHFRSRAAIREVGRAMGLSEDVTSALAGQVWHWSREALCDERLREIGLDPADDRLRLTLALTEEIIGFPRHLSQHVGGFVITQGRLDELCPIENAAMADRTVIEWDKDDIDALGLLKVDVLALGMLTCVRKALDLIHDHTGAAYTLATLPPEDGAVYDMLCAADSLGVFQVESRAQMAFLPRMRPRSFYDLVIEVAIVRPGPIQGDMVHPYLRRRSGEEAVSYPSGDLEDVLSKTLGVPLFQEQCMRIAVVAAGFSADEADGLRRALATFRRTGTIHTYRERFVSGCLANGYERAFAERCFAQIEGFGEYGFPESHAASFALLVYASAWLKRRHPAAFCAALLNSQPMGFYAPAQIVRDAREHGVAVRPVSVNHGDWDCTLEADTASTGGLAVRLGLRMVKGLREEDGRWIAAARANGYPDVDSLWRRAGVGRRGVEALARADAFAAAGTDGSAAGPDRRAALWAARAISGAPPVPLFAAGEGIAEAPSALPAETPGEAVVADYRATQLSLRAHPLALLRGTLDADATGSGERRRRPVSTCADLADHAHGARVRLAGLVLTRQRPGTASGVTFLTLEDETATASVVVWKGVYERFRRAVIAGRLLVVTGRLQREGAVTHLIAARIEDRSDLLDRLLPQAGTSGGRLDGSPSSPRADEEHPPVDAAPYARRRREEGRGPFPSRDFQ
ncbi:MAG: error-prone DNA polymerase [Paracoccaceae bacterium]